MKKILFPLFIISLFVLSSCNDDNTIPEINLNVDPRYHIEINEDTLLSLVNIARTSGYTCEGTYYPPVSEVKWNDVIEEASRLNSDYMFQFSTLGHIWSDGTNAGNRLNSVNYKWSIYGENAAYGNMTEITVVQGWLNSPGHCKNIMNGSFKFMGVTRTENYWNQVFAN